MPCLGSLEHMCPLESAGGSRYFRPGTCRYRYYNIRNIHYKLVINFYLKFSSSKSPFCSRLAHPANHAVWHGPGPRLSELAFFFSLKNRKYTHFLKICVLGQCVASCPGLYGGLYGQNLPETLKNYIELLVRGQIGDRIRDPRQILV